VEKARLAAEAEAVAKVEAWVEAKATDEAPLAAEAE